MTEAELTTRSAYALGRDFNASTRYELFLQHYLWRRQLGYLLSPTVQIDNFGKELRVADVACGTGQWLIDLARELPQAQLEGFDISSTQFAPVEWLPKNVKLSTLDALGDIPEHMQEKYDIVHVGLVVVVLGHKRQKFIRNLNTLLKSDGYLQWDEADLDGLSLGNANPLISNRNLKELYRRVDNRFAPPGTDFSWARHLDKLFAWQGLKVLENEYYQISDDIAYPWSHMQLSSLAELIRSLNDTDENLDEWWELYNAATSEVVQGAGIRMGMIVATARKP